MDDVACPHLELAEAALFPHARAVTSAVQAQPQLPTWLEQNVEVTIERLWQLQLSFTIMASVQLVVEQWDRQQSARALSVRELTRNRVADEKPHVERRVLWLLRWIFLRWRAKGYPYFDAHTLFLEYRVWQATYGTDQPRPEQRPV